MQREEKQLESALEAITLRVNDLKNSIANMIFKIEHEYETLNWPTFLDNYALLSGHLTALSKILSHDKSPPLRSLTVLPLLLSPERDEALSELTEGRVTTFAHDLVPNYLRTKLEPMADIRMGQLENKAASLSYEAAQKQIAAYQKVVNHIWDIINKAREDWESESGARQGAQQTSSVSDTHQLVAAVGMGKGLKMQGQPVVGPGGPVGPGQMQPGGAIMGAPQGVRGNTMPQTNTSGQPTMGPGGVMGPGGGKAPSAIKTNIKPANQIHPYGR